METMKAPFPWFGGKSRAADLIWARLGRVDNYVEPFAGSLAVLLGSPRIHRHETINDFDGFVANFWRALASDPDKLAHYADHPVNENDLHARHVWLVGRRNELTARLEGDPDYYDAKIAGWWVWGICCWIGSGWCAEHAGPWAVVDGRLVKTKETVGQKRQLPHLGDSGVGVNRKRPHLGNSGMGINRQRPHLGTSGQGVNRKLPHLGDSGKGVNRQRPHLGNSGQGLLAWMRDLSDRLRRVRVCCGDWSRIVGYSPTTNLGVTAVMLDPPYSEGERAMDLYARDSGTVAADVREWALAHGDDPKMRIVLCGYDTEHIMPGWSKQAWKANGGYGGQGDGNNKNRFREMLYFSPHCISGAQGELF